MVLESAVSQINDISSKSESIFLQLGNLFPSLLNQKGGTSILELEKMLSNFDAANNNSSRGEKDLFTDYGAKYNPLFDQLNEKIEDLGQLDKMIAEIKEDSEQMELIALNAMVISIKSGEKGQAFSRITENLQRLSNDMFLFSDKLSEEEAQLLNYINNLKKIFSGILDSQKALSSKGSSSTSDVNNLISNVKYPLNSINGSISSIYPPIQKAMEGLQLQDMIRQSLDHVKSCIKEVAKPNSAAPGSEDELDYVSFNISLLELACDVLKDIDNYVKKSCNIFTSNWTTVIETLDKVENSKDDFEHRFLSEYSVSSENINKKLTSIIGDFDEMMGEFNNYHTVQKDLLHTCQNITARARTIYSVFDNLRPVMSRLHHVRILQQIEVSKNDAIKSVQDSVTDMDNLIASANKSLDTMQTLLENFIQDTGSMLSTFTSSIGKDNENMIALKNTKTRFFDELKIGQGQLASIMQNFTVFPDGFQSKCVTVNQNMQELNRISSQISDFISNLKSTQKEMASRKATLMNNLNIAYWEIKNTKFAELIKHFTITAHKEAAGKIVGMSVEKGTPAGEITFF
ncbi:MAG: hypothetical protein KBT11_11635 [Treponema sp.]|nr:hypothetical protein [Candidatus Treponema equifaecale]